MLQKELHHRCWVVFNPEQLSLKNYDAQMFAMAKTQIEEARKARRCGGSIH